MAIWGNNHFEEKYNLVIDPDCGHGVQIAYHCPQCESNKKTKTKIKLATKKDLTLFRLKSFFVCLHNIVMLHFCLNGL
jgi:hypothetical protein